MTSQWYQSTRLLTYSRSSVKILSIHVLCISLRLCKLKLKREYAFLRTFRVFMTSQWHHSTKMLTDIKSPENILSIHVSYASARLKGLQWQGQTRFVRFLRILKMADTFFCLERADVNNFMVKDRLFEYRSLWKLGLSQRFNSTFQSVG